MIGQVLILILLETVISIEQRVRTWPKLRGIRYRGSFKYTKFLHYTDSNELCQEFHAEWYESMSLQRLDLQASIYDAWLYALFMEISWPEPKMSGSVPVQSMQSRLGGLTTKSMMQGPLGFKYYDKNCYTTCEDLRSDAEIYLDYLMNDVIEVRDKPDFHMLCPDNFYAELYDAADERPSSHPDYEPVLRPLLDLGLTYNRALRENRHKFKKPPRELALFERYPMSRPQVPRAVNGLVKRCRCKPIRTEDEYAESASTAVVDAIAGSVVASRMRNIGETEYLAASITRS